VPGIGKILSLVLLDEIHDIARFPSVQDFVSYYRLVKCAKESAGKRYGTAGTKIGHAYLQWAVSEAAVLFLRENPAGQKDLARLETQHGKGKALTVLAHKLARAVYDMLKRGVGFDLDKFLHHERGSERACGLTGHDGLRLVTVLCHNIPSASTNAHEHRGPLPSPSAFDWTPAPASIPMARVPLGDCVLPLTRT
jgi:hypothetical protein